MDVLISRQQAIDEAERWLFNLEDKRTVGEMLRDVPPVQPEIVRCEECINYIDHRCRIADHHVASFSTCQSVFGAERREKGEKLCQS